MPDANALAAREAVAAERCTSLYGVPTMFIAELAHERFPEFDLSTFRTGVMAGSPPRPPPAPVVLATAARAATVACGPTSAAQPASGTVSGRVVGSDGAPVTAAVVRVLAEARDLVTQTDAAGRFMLRGVATGVVRLDVRRLGFLPRIVGDVVVRAGKPAEVRVVLDATAVGLAGVTVRPTYFPTTPLAATPVSTAGFSTEEIRRAPGVQEDVVRAVGVLPGISPTTEQRNDLVVRGGAPVENLFVVDGLEVPNINQFAAQGSTGGPESVLPLDFVRSATVSTGGFGARYGDRASSVVDIELRDGTRERLAGQLNVSVLEAAVLAEGPLGGSGSFLAGVRRSYLGPVFRWLNAGVIPSLEDATFKAALHPSRRDDLSWFGVVAKGTVGVDRSTDQDRYGNRVVVAPEETQYFTGVTWRHRLARGLLSTTLGRTSAAFKTDQSGPLEYGGPSETLFRAHTTEAENQLRTTLVWSPGDAAAAMFEVGTIAKYADRLHYDVYLPGLVRRDANGYLHTLRTDTTFTAFRDATYAQADVRLAPRVHAVLGVRADYYGFLANAVRVAPRAALTWAVDDASAVTLAGGRYWQAPQPIWLAGDATNRPDAAGGGVRPFRADHVVLGWQHLVRPDVQLRVEGYAKRYAEYPARVYRPSAVLQPGTFDDALTDIPFGLEPLASVGTGRVTGAEALVQKKLSDVPVYGLAALSVSRATFTALQGGAAPSAFDVPVIATVLAGWRPAARWEFSARARAASGAPTTPFVTDGPLYGTLDPTRYDRGPRRTPFFSLDARVNRRFLRRGGRELVVYVDVQDVTDRHNWFSEDWSAYRGAPFHITTLGRLPSAGLNWVF